ncbi:hypothetical protein [uncultured Senegalimassilia sp.]|uniref:hypothetical protein n=1 Tax=uncultured Senegalimassilia sp. TaxID=1714350 RepID=UPI0027DD8653|nr:hypothetical protein [uncultured Senegalimassilia sp.]
MTSFDARPAGNGLTRRTMIKTSAVLIGSCALGFTGVASLGCSADDIGGGAFSNDSDQVTLHVDGQRFFIDGDAAGTAFSGAALSLVPNLADGTIALCYRDSENPDPCCTTLASLGSPVIVTGTLRMLNVDGVNSDGVVSIQPDAAISVLSLGSIKTADIEGSVDHLIVVGKSDAVAHDGARIGQATLGDSCADLVINANSSVGDVDAPFEAQVSGEGADGARVTITGDEGAAEQRHGTLLEAANDDAAWEDAVAALAGTATVHQAKAPAGSGPASATTAASATAANTTAASANPFAPQTAYADEAASDVVIDTENTAADDDNDENLLSFTPGEPLETDSEPDMSSDDQSTEDFQQDVAALGAEDPAPEADVAIEAIDLLIAGLKFIGEQTAGRAFEYGSSSLLELVFGGNDESAQIISKLTEIQGQLDDIEREIAQVIAQFDKQACYLQVNNYLSKFSAEMRWDLSKLSSMTESIDALPDGDEKEARRKEFAENLYSNPRYQVCGRYVYDMAGVLGNEIMQCYTGTNKNLFGAFDELMVLSYKWEHHGYEMRANFQSSVLSNFMALINYSTFCLNEHYLVIKDDPEKKTELAEWLGFWKGLFGTATLPETALALLAEGDDADGAATGVSNEVAAMATAQKLVKRADNIRYYQVPGHQVQIAANAANVRTTKDGGLTQKQLMKDSAGHCVLAQDQLVNMYLDYDKKKTLTDILFGEGEGNLAAPRDTGAPFVAYQLPLIDERQMKHPSHLYRHKYYAPIVNNDGTTGRAYVALYDNGKRIFNFTGIAVYRV